MNLLSAIFLIPLIAAGLIVLIPRTIRWGIRVVALMATFVTMVLGVILFCKYGNAEAIDGYKFTYFAHWVSLDLSVSKLFINYHVGVDGINLGLVVMGSIVAFAATCLSKEINKFEKEYYFLLMIMTGGILGAFVSLDLFFFYFFHELALVPTFIMIGVWGRGLDRNYATFKITIYLSVGALLALVGLVMLYLQTGQNTFNIVELTKYVQEHPIGAAEQKLIFPILLFGFGILVSLWPFHTWAPTGYAHAPTATAMLHAGVLKKFGLYGLLRVAIPLLPTGAAAWLEILALLCLGNILYCGLVAIKQKDLNFLIGNSSVAHMGFVFLGIASLTLIGVTGAVVLMVAHGFLAALTFGISGWIRHHTGTTEIGKLGGLLKQLPVVGSFMIVALLAGCGLPGFGNFIGEFMVLFGSWKTFPVVTGIAIWGALVIGAVYMLRAIRNVLHGPMNGEYAKLRDADVFRKLPFAILTASLLLLGIFPRLLTDHVKPSVAGIVELTKVEAPAATTLPAAPAEPAPHAKVRAQH
jgi:NADH-quinone oxidoreductase subunit M